MMAPYVAKTQQPCKTTTGQLAKGLQVKLPTSLKYTTPGDDELSIVGDPDATENHLTIK